MSDIPEINIKVKSFTVTGGEPIKMTVRNMFYRGFKGKIKTIWTWIRHHRDKSFKDYLNTPVKWTRTLPNDVNSYHGIDAEEELKKLLEEDLDGELVNELKTINKGE